MFKDAIDGSGFSSGTQRKNVDRRMAVLEAGRRYAADLGTDEVMRRLRQAATEPARPRLLQIHTGGIAQQQGEWIQHDTASLGQWFLDAAQRVEPDKRAQAGLCIDAGEGCLKRAATARGRSVLFFDCDHSHTSVQGGAKRLEGLGLAFVLRESYRSTASTPRWGAVILLDGYVRFDAYQGGAAAMKRQQLFLLGILSHILDGTPDASGVSLGRLVFTGCRPDESTPPRAVYWHEGRGLSHNEAMRVFEWEKWAPTIEQTCGSATEYASDLGAALEIHAELSAALPNTGRLSYERRVWRYRSFLATSSPCREGQAAGARMLHVGRVGVAYLLLQPEDVTDIILQSDWNRRCVDKDGKPYPWEKGEIEYKVRTALETCYPHRLGFWCGTVAPTRLEVA